MILQQLETLAYNSDVNLETEEVGDVYSTSKGLLLANQARVKDALLLINRAIRENNSLLYEVAYQQYQKLVLLEMVAMAGLSTVIFELHKNVKFNKAQDDDSSLQKETVELEEVSTESTPEEPTKASVDIKVDAKVEVSATRKPKAKKGS